MNLPRPRWWQVLAGALVVAALAGAALVMQSRVKRTLVIATGPEGSAYAYCGEQYRLLLERSGVAVILKPTGGTIENLRLINDPGSGVDVTFLSAGTTNADKSPDLRSLGTVFLEDLWFFSRDPVLSQGDLAELRGKRLSIGTDGSATRSISEALLRLLRLDRSSMELVGLAPQEAAKQLREGDIQAAIIMTSADFPVVRELLADPEIDLVSFRRAPAYAALYPFLTPLTVPEGVGNLSLNRPPTDVSTHGAPVSLVVRSGMHPALQALLLRAASEIHDKPGMFNAAGRFPAPEPIDLPLSDAAVQYYKSGIPLLQRYLPFWAAVLVGQLLLVLVPLLGVLYPVLRLGPALYGWAMRHRIYRLYGELKFLEHELDGNPTNEQKLALRDRLEQLDHRVGRMHIPIAYASMVYTTRLHIDLVRSRL